MRRSLALLVFALAAVPAVAQTYGDIRINVVVPAKGGRHGYAEVRFEVSSTASAARKVQVVLPAESQPGDRGVLASVAGSVEVAAGGTAHLSLPFPMRPGLQGGGAYVHIDGQRQQDPLSVSPPTGMRYPGSGRGRYGPRHHKSSSPREAAAVFLHSQGLSEDLFRDALHRPIPIQAERATAPVTQWSRNWLAYTRYDGIVVRATELHSLSTGGTDDQHILEALWRYAEAGGTLVVVGTGKVAMPASWAALRPIQDGGLTRHAVAFGECVHWKQEPRPGTNLPEDAYSAMGRAATPWQHERGLADLHATFPVVDRLGVPTTGLFILMLVFAAVIGPVNLIILAQMNRRIWMLWTVPAISAATCLVVLVYMVLAEGWTGHARVAGITLLDQPGRRATTLARAAYYSPMTPSDGLRFPLDAEVSAFGEDHIAGESACTLEWGSDQHLKSGWITARIPSHFRIRRSQARVQERLDITRRDDGTLAVANHLGVDVRELVVAGADGKLHRGGPIPAGQEAALRLTDEVATGTPASWRELYATGDWGLSGGRIPNAPMLLGPNSYLAIVEQSPFLQPGLRGAAVRAAPSAVLGIYEPRK